MWVPWFSPRCWGEISRSSTLISNITYKAFFFNSHQHARMIKVLSPLFGWGCGVSNLCWNSDSLHLLRGVLRINSSNTASGLQSRGQERPQRTLTDRAQLRWGVCKPEPWPCLETRHGHLEKHLALLLRGFSWIKPLSQPGVSGHRRGALPTATPRPGQRRALQGVFCHSNPHLTCTHRLYLFVASYNPL